jgi:hypothetical protein
MNDIPLRPAVASVNELKRADFEIGNYLIWVPNHRTFDEVMTPGFWAQCTGMMRQGYRVQVMRLDLTLDLELRVIEVKPGLVKMRVLRKYVSDENLRGAKGAQASKAADDEADQALAMPDGYKYVHIPRGAEAGHAVQLKSTGEWLKKGLGSKAAAVAAANAHKAEAESIPA